MADERGTSLETLAHLKKMRAAARLAADVLDAVAAEVKEGVTTDQLNSFCHDMIVARGGEPAPLGFKGFPKSICTSVNHVAAHGIPSDQPLHDGDLLKIDVSVKLDGVYGDNCRSYFVGTPSERAKDITTAAYNAMIRGIEQVRAGNTVADIGTAIDRSATFAGYSVLHKFNGHGIGEELHMPPKIYAYPNLKDDVELKAGMIFTVEPLLTEGGNGYTMDDNGEVRVAPEKLSAQFEHMVLVMDKGCEILTESPRGIYVPSAIRPDVVKLGRRGAV